MSAAQTHDEGEVILDCDAGRRMGCHSFCCRLVVRLRPGERAPNTAVDTFKSCVDKDPRSGLCVHFDTESARCLAWEERPFVCREYDCNKEPLLQIVLRDGFTSLTALVQATPSSGGAARRIPYLQKVRPNAKPATVV